MTSVSVSLETRRQLNQMRSMMEFKNIDLFLEHFGLKNLLDLPNKDELKSSGFLEKRSAIATITDIADNENVLEVDDFPEEIESLDDFIPKREN